MEVVLFLNTYTEAGDVRIWGSVGDAGTFLLGDIIDVADKISLAIRKGRRLNRYFLEYLEQDRDFLNVYSPDEIDHTQKGVFQIDEDGNLVKFHQNMSDTGRYIKRTQNIRGRVATVVALIKDCVWK